MSGIGNSILEHSGMSLWLAGLIVLALYLPFGYWGKTLRKFSWLWFLSIHAPVPIVVAIRVLGGLGWHPLTFVVLVGSFFSRAVPGRKA